MSDLNPKRIPRANRQELFQIFQKYASHKTASGEVMMTGHDFIQKFIGMNIMAEADEETLAFLTGIVDSSKDGFVSFDEFAAFEGLLTQPDSIYLMAFKLFDLNSSGYISFNEFKKVYQKTVAFSHCPFNFDCEFVKLHFGKNRNKELSYSEFTQFLQGVQEEHAKQAFDILDPKDTGYIRPVELKEIMTTIRTHLLTPHVADNMVAVTGGQRVSYPFFEGVNKLLSGMEVVRRVFDSIVDLSPVQKVRVSKEEFLHAAQAFSQVTPLEIDILFKFASLNHDAGFINRGDFDLIAPREDAVEVFDYAETVALNDKAESRGFLLATAESLYRFGLGSAAGAIGATAVYPIDLVKTRMQNQRTTVGEILYKNSFDCFRKVIKFEGVAGLYKGLPPQLVGVAPEKAIKLTMNDFVRDQLKAKDGTVPIYGQILAGGMAGASQVMFTNPLEIVKIRLQVSGEIAHTRNISAIQVIRELGLFGLYKGSRACFLRDIPFSAIYFPLYAFLKKRQQDADGRNSPISLFIAGVGAGVPAPFLTTPADVIKTRLQVKAREGRTTYNGVIDCAKKIWREEGWKAFWKGSGARVFRSAPQFGVTLLSYELLQRTFPVDFLGSRPEGSQKKHKVPEYVSELPPINPDHVGGLHMAVAAFAGIESKFGLFLPKFVNPIQHKLIDFPGYAHYGHLRTGMLSTDSVEPSN